MKKVTEKQNRNKQTNKDKVKKQLAQQYFAPSIDQWMNAQCFTVLIFSKIC